MCRFIGIPTSVAALPDIEPVLFVGIPIRKIAAMASELELKVVPPIVALLEPTGDIDDIDNRACGIFDVGGTTDTTGKLDTSPRSTVISGNMPTMAFN